MQGLKVGRWQSLIAIGVLTLLLGSCAWMAVFATHWTLTHARAFARELERAAVVVETGRQNPVVAIPQAEKHLAAARAELETLRPVAEPVVIQADRLVELPGVGPVAEEVVALWHFANATTTLGETLLDAAELGITHLQADDMAGLEAAIPVLQNHLQQAEVQFAQAQAARSRLDTVTWLPADLATALDSALSRWDALAPGLGETLTTANQLLDEIDVVQAWQQAQSLARELKQVARILETAPEDRVAALRQAQPHLTAARTAFEALRPAAERVIARADKFAGLSGVALPVGQIGAWWRFADATTALGAELANAAELGLLNLEQAGIDGLIAAMPTLRGHLQATEISLARAQAARPELEAVTWLPDELTIPLATFLTQWDASAPTLAESLPFANRLARILPLMLGSDRPVTYLLLLQSSDELRATGGFIGGIGTVRIEAGRITDVVIGEVKEFDNNPILQNEELFQWRQPPQPLVRYMGLGHWYLRDANWWADFPATARQAAEFWSVENDTPVDGVIAITDQGIGGILQAVGPVKTLDGTLVNAENIKELAAVRMYQSDQSKRVEQSVFLQEMALVFVALTKEFSSEKALKLGRYLEKAVARHELLVTSFDPPLAAALHELGVDGALGGQQDDYFYLVETNVSYNKLSPFIRQDLTYEVELGADGRPILATLTVDELNTYTPGAGLAGYPEGYYQGGRWNPQTRQVDKWERYYGGYTRLYPPPGSEFLTATGFDEGPQIVTEHHRTVIGGYVGLVQGVPRQLQFKWVPAGQPSVPGQYRLFVQRQPGAPEHALSVVVHLPAGYRATEITPPPIFLADDTVTWHALLDQDQTFSLMLAETEDVVTGTTVSSAELARPAAPAPPPASPAAAAAPTTPRPVAPAPPPPPGRAPLPVWLSIPTLGVGAPIVSVGLEPSGIMASPGEPDLVGWYELGPRPGEPSNAVLAGHVDWKGEIGAFSRLHELEPGDTVEVQTGPDVGFRYVVESIETYQADRAPVADIFGATSGPILTLITCGGPYDVLRQEYRDRLVVRARGE